MPPPPFPTPMEVKLVVINHTDETLSLRQKDLVLLGGGTKDQVWGGRENKFVPAKIGQLETIPHTKT